jgi:hypothetical protein
MILASHFLHNYHLFWGYSILQCNYEVYRYISIHICHQTSTWRLIVSNMRYDFSHLNFDLTVALGLAHNINTVNRLHHHGCLYYLYSSIIRYTDLNYLLLSSCHPDLCRSIQCLQFVFFLFFWYILVPVHSVDGRNVAMFLQYTCNIRGSDTE